MDPPKRKKALQYHLQFKLYSCTVVTKTGWSYPSLFMPLHELGVMSCRLNVRMVYGTGMGRKGIIKIVCLYLSTRKLSERPPTPRRETRPMHLKPSAQMGVSFHAHPLSIARRVIGQNTSSPLIGNIPPPRIAPMLTRPGT